MSISTDAALAFAGTISIVVVLVFHRVDGRRYAIYTIKVMNLIVPPNALEPTAVPPLRFGRAIPERVASAGVTVGRLAAPTSKDGSRQFHDSSLWNGENFGSQVWCLFEPK
jgi:hypothetical protein